MSYLVVCIIESFPLTLRLYRNSTKSMSLPLAFYESQLMSDEKIIRNGAYFARVSDTFTRHFLIFAVANQFDYLNILLPVYAPSFKRTSSKPVTLLTVCSPIGANSTPR